MRFAVSDGATEAFDSRRWARYLVTTWVTTQRVHWSPEVFVQTAKLIGERFTRRIDQKTFPWYAAEKAASGSFAAFVGIEVTPNGEWKALAVGDCCMFQERGNELIVAFPLTAPECFNSRPALIPSLPQAIDAAVGELKTCSGQLEDGDHIWLMSDAIACWYLTNHSGTAGRGSSPNRLLSAVLAGDAETAALIRNERALGNLRNDDVAVLYIKAVSSPQSREQ
ncbi:MAG TPA: hypothetical protein VKV05_15065 [Terriglobales bacterium]|nr:hypothetical protein [Terriglobales bacterium]